MNKQTELSTLIDQTYTVRAKRLGAQHMVDDMKDEEAGLTKRIMELLRDAKLEGAHGKKGRATINRTFVPTLTDADEFLKWGKKKGNEDMLKIGVDAAAWRARVAEGVKVPGVESFCRESISIGKAA